VVKMSNKSGIFCSSVGQYVGLFVEWYPHPYSLIASYSSIPLLVVSPEPSVYSLRCSPLFLVDSLGSSSGRFLQVVPRRTIRRSKCCLPFSFNRYYCCLDFVHHIVRFIMMHHIIFKAYLGVNKSNNAWFVACCKSQQYCFGLNSHYVQDMKHAVRRVPKLQMATNAEWHNSLMC
jgi:hypothetical protein